MSRGRIGRAITALFDAAPPEAAFTADDLICVAYPGIRLIEQKHRISVLRAAKKQLPVGWRAYRERYTPDHLNQDGKRVHLNVAPAEWGCTVGPLVFARTPEAAWYRLSGLTEPSTDLSVVWRRTRSTRATDEHLGPVTEAEVIEQVSVGREELPLERPNQMAFRFQFPNGKPEFPEVRATDLGGALQYLKRSTELQMRAKAGLIDGGAERKALIGSLCR